MRSQAPAKAIALQRSPAAVIQTAVDIARETLASDVTFAAVAGASSDFPIASANGVRDPRWSSIVVRPRLGLGGEVLASGRSMIVGDYASDARISRDFVEIVAHGEGLRAVACVPVLGPASIEALLYAGAHGEGVLGERAVTALEHFGTLASVGIEAIRDREIELELTRLRERELVASQLHDSVAQRLFAIGALARASRGRTDIATLTEAIDEIDTTAADARRELRETLLQLEAEPENLAFEAQLEGELHLLEGVTGCATRVTRRGAPVRMPQDIARLMIDTAVEGTRNAAKHVRARLAVIEIHYEDHNLSLAVASDSTTGFAQTFAARPPSTGVGLRTLRNRANRLGGTLELVTTRTGCVELRLELPYSNSACR